MTESPKPSVTPPTPTTPPPSKSLTEKAQTTATNTYRLLRLVVFAVVAVIATLFVVRNWEDVNLDYVFGDVMMPLALVMLVSAGIGAILAILGRWLWFRD